jgi:Zn-dependent peptidase ImmA (M78 family)
MALLMPRKLVNQWLAKNSKEWFYTEDDLLKEIARAFGVSVTVAAIRLTKLGYWKV